MHTVFSACDVILFLVIITSLKLGIPRAGMGMNILLREGMGMLLYAAMGMGIRSWKWDRKSRSCTSLIIIVINTTN